MKELPTIAVALGAATAAPATASAATAGFLPIAPAALSPVLTPCGTVGTLVRPRVFDAECAAIPFRKDLRDITGFLTSPLAMLIAVLEIPGLVLFDPLFDQILLNNPIFVTLTDTVYNHYCFHFANPYYTQGNRIEYGTPSRP